SAVLVQLPPRTQHYYTEFRRCQGCGQVYWKGSHYRRMQRRIDEILRQACPPSDAVLAAP
ncbi:MAG: hypothetical protein GX605_02745, partial [Chloroflexi bacterium]|nr:hypothetical protein [Chloroflexota bacterium]